MTDLLNFNGMWFVLTVNWLWILLALAIGVWFGWATSAPDEG
jgi:hypothetical protein